MKGKTLFFILLLLISLNKVFAQKEISGRVLDTDTRKPVDAATVTLHPKGSASILAYTMTAKDGTFTLKRASMPDSVTVSVRAMNIEGQSKTVKSDVGFVEFLVKEKVTELKEVIVKAPKIRQLGDTIHYDVASFLDETDRSIGDVLKKLPGVQVLSSGQILYQNKAISKFYVEGLDLLKGKYGIATQNIDAKNVASVQVLENHQPIKALKEMEIPETAAINLKLKQSALGAFFATVQAGAGLPTVLLSNELVAMRFTQRQQNMAVYKGDNTGRDIAQELTSFYGGTDDAAQRFLNVVSPSSPSINQQHFLFNDAHLGSLNDLRTLNKALTLTTNINYLADKQKSDSYARREIFIENGENIRIEEDMSARLLKHELEAAVTLEGNTDDYFLNNKVNVSAKWNDESGEIRAEKPVYQRLSLPSVHAANNFEYLRRTGKRRFRLQSDISFTTQENELRVTPSLFGNLSDNSTDENSLMQAVSYNRFATNTSVSGSVEGKVSFWYSGSVFTNHHTFNSSLYEGMNTPPLSADSLLNNLTRGEIGLRVSPGMRIAFSEKIRPTINLPVTYLMLQKNDNVRHFDNRRGYWLFAPSLYLDFPIATRLSLYANVRFSNNIGGMREDLLGYMMTSYRNLHRNTGLQSESSSANASAYFNYRNPFTTLFMTLSFNWVNTWRNTLYDTRYTGVLSNVNTIRHPHSSPSYGVHASVGKSIDAIRSETRLNVGYSRSKSVALNQGVVSPFSSENYRVSGSITTDIGRWMIVKYNGLYSNSRTKVSDNRLKPMHYFTQSLNTSFIPKKGLIFNIGFNHYYNNAITSSARSSWFGNAGVRYKTKNVDWMLDWTNVFNTRQFVTYSYSDVSSYFSEYALRPTEVLLRVRFKIL